MKNGKQTALHGVLPVDFEPVWISSIEHLRAFEKAYRDTPLVRRIIGAYVLTDGFPCMRGGLIIPHRIPVVMFSSGKLRIDRHVVEFETAAWRHSHVQYHNLRTNWKFTLTGEDITAIESFAFISPVMRYFTLPFTRVRTRGTGELADLLLCVGGSGPSMKEVRTRSAELSARLHEAFPEATRA